MFSVTDLIIDPFNAEVAAAAASGESAAIVDYLDPDEIGTSHALGKMHLEDISLGFTAVGKLEVMLPFIEQDNLDKITNFSDGSSNTIMFAEVSSGRQVSRGLHIELAGGTSNGIIAVLIGLAVDPADPSDHDSSAASLDTWEHASMDRHGPTNNGIIAILIGLAADPADPSDRASQIAHDLEFEKWASTSKFDRGQESSSFYDLLISSYLKRTQDHLTARTLSIASDGAFINIQSILHEDNEFAIPRMITAAGFAKAN